MACATVMMCTNVVAAAPKSRRRKRSPADSPATRGDREKLVRYSASMVSAKKLVHGEVKILKRGQLLVNSRGNTEEGEGVLDPKPETLKKVVAAFYAGSGKFSSPPASSVPIPGFMDSTLLIVT